MMKYLPLLLLSFLVLMTSETQSASYPASDSTFITKKSVYSADSTKVKVPKTRSRLLKTISTLSTIAGAVLFVLGGILRSVPTAIIGGILLIIAILTAKKKRKNEPKKIPQPVPSNSSKKGLASPEQMFLIVLGGIIAGLLLIKGFVYLILSRGI